MILNGKLDNFVASQDELGCIKWIKSLSHSHKRELCVYAMKRLITTSNYDLDRALPEASMETLRAAVFGIATVAELVKLDWKLKLRGERDIELIKAYEFDFEKVNEWILATYQAFNETHFMFGYRKYKLGLCDRPSNEHYVYRLILAFVRTDFPSLKHGLLAYPDILDIEFWRLFELEGSADCNLAGSEIYSNLNWTTTVIELCEEGYLSRNRLLEASLDALARDFVSKRAGWFSRFHEALKPSVEERTQFEARYCHLLGSQNPPTVSFALKALVVLNKHIQLNVGALQDALSAVMYAKSKATVTTGIKLVKAILKRNSNNQLSFCRIVADALAHENVDVQSSVIDFLEEFGDKNDPQLVQMIAKSADLVNPSQQIKIAPWLRSEANEGSLSTSNNALIFDVNSTDAFTQYQKIDSSDELVQALGEFLESPQQPDVYEAILSASVELYSQEPERLTARLQPLKARAAHFHSKPYEHGAHQLIAKLILSLLSKINLINQPKIEKSNGSQGADSDFPLSFAELCISHTYHAIELCLNSNSSFLLATPTHGRGFVCPNDLIRRYLFNHKHNIDMPVTEMVLALFRVDIRIPLHYELPELNVKSEYIDCIFYACGAEVEFGSTLSIWVAASRIRNTNREDSKAKNHFKITGPDFFEPASYEVQFRKHKSKSGKFSWCWLDIYSQPELPINPSLHFPSSMFHQDCGYHAFASDRLFGETDFGVRWVSTVWPSNMTAYFACALEAFSPNENTRWVWKCFFEPMLYSDVEMDDMATALLLLGLGGYTPCQKGMAIEAAIQSIAENRLSVSEAASWLSRLMTSEYVVPKRWVKTFSEVTSVSEKHSQFIRELITESLQFDPAISPVGLGNILEFVYELYIQSGKTIKNETAIRFLQSNKKGGKQGKFARLLLQI